MNEASTEIVQASDGRVPTARRLGIVSIGEQLPSPSPEELAACVVAVATSRDREAFAALYRHFGPRLKSFFMRGGFSAGLAEDLVQETLLSMWRKASYFDPGRASVATWLFTIARNLRIDHLRRQRNPADLPHEPEETPPSLEDTLLGEERDIQVRRALDGLSQDQQTILRLSYYSEKSQSEIASELGIPLGTVKSRARLAMTRLRSLLENET